jgi:hypothetical protein
LAITVCLTSNAIAQQLHFNDFELVKGDDLEKGAQYRFYNVTQGVDAVIKVEKLSNATLGYIDDSPISSSVKDNAAWRPMVSGVSENGKREKHYAEFEIAFYANGSNKKVKLSDFTMTIFDTDGDNDRADFSDRQDGDVIEFAEVDGFEDLLSFGSNLNVSNDQRTVTAKNSLNNDGVTDAAPWVSVWSFEDAEKFNVSFGWEGTDKVMNADNDRLYGAYFTGDTKPTFEIVPEPSTAMMVLCSLFTLIIRRKR